ncbi:response regulator [Novispirillum itersonii]|uniref:response regulator n=1 Tax=Novispirillum itersonii TaxID=189 RepID=UPI000379133D|nr:response regulator [Novispirillum itersonii]
MGHRILFVDDEKNVLSAIRRTFHSDFIVETSGNAPEALKKFMAGEVFAVTVTDMDMPGVTGRQLVQQIRRIAPWTARIILTGKPSIDLATEMLANDEIFRYLLKPSSPEKLREAIQEGIQWHIAKVEELGGINPGIILSSVSDLMPGDEITADVVSTQGNVLVRRGSIADAATIDALRRLEAAGRLITRVPVRRFS